MGRDLSHSEVRELLGAFALDAVDADEAQAVEAHLDECQPCRTEVREHREVAAMLASGWSPAPDGVWDRIAGSLEEAPPAMVIPLGAARVEREERRRRRAGAGPVRAAIAMGVAASVALVAFLGVKVVDTSHQVDHLAAQLADGDVGRAAAAAAHRPDARLVSLRSTDGQRSADAVLLPDGTGYLVKTDLPQLKPERTYQLWAVVGSAKISVGVLGPSPGPVAFHAPPDAAALAITEEQAGGVVTSFQSPTVVGTFA
jgi:hypothetical protein